MKKIKFLILYIFIFTLLSSCSGRTPGNNNQVNSSPVTESGFYIGTHVTITLYDGGGRNVMKSAFSLLNKYEEMLSRNIESSDVSRINKYAGEKGYKVSEETLYVIEKGIFYSRVSGGLFDITIGPVVDLWGIGTESARVPAENEITAALSKIGLENMFIDRQERVVFLEKKEMSIDLGAIAKGFIADKVAGHLKDNNAAGAIVNLGGNVVVIGEKPGGEPFRIGVQDPFDSRGSYLGIITGKDMSVVTSGTYERYFEKDGKLYHHILSPQTGYPVNNDIMGISVITEKSIDGDGLSTALYVLGARKGLEEAEKLKDTDVIIITRDKKIYLSGMLESRFTLLNSDFEISKALPPELDEEPAE